MVTEPKLKKAKLEHPPENSKTSLDDLFIELDSNSMSQVRIEDELLDAEISKALASINEYNTNPSTSSSPEDLSPFDSPNIVSSSSDLSNQEIHEGQQKGEGSNDDKRPTVQIPLTSMAFEAPTVNMDTISTIKSKMLDTSRFISTFTTLKATYLKLCKEFNYLLTKFNENERIKIELIHENNELKKLLTQIITERELERKKNSRKRDFQSVA
ncbi:protein Atc1p/LIC4 [[Candida] railenensis]|uniref:Protein Atc1p/LIC4 n=1 Tax=[Candida] railenensis TaxID=45579 RepID=A0A9P0W0N7_9ASCO|nr:protein Atc1p/LIC4 [[Candida] railenensis]